MNESEIAEYLAKLMNRPVAADTVLVLSSAQRARFRGWLSQNGVQIDGAQLRGNFTVGRLLAGGESDPRSWPVGALDDLPNERTSSVPTGDGDGISVGIDIQHVDELLRAANLNDFKGDPTLAEIFTLRELSYAQSSETAAETLAGIFAAKEAVRKCMGTRDISREQFRGLEILPDRDGKPRFREFEISISHSGGFAVAVACGGRSKCGTRRAESSVSAGSDELASMQVLARGSVGLYKRLLWVSGVLIALQAALFAVLLIGR